MRAIKYIVIWFLLSIPLIILFSVPWFLFKEFLSEMGVKFEYLIVIALELSTIVFLQFYALSPKLLLKWYKAEEMKSGRLLEIFRKITEEQGVNAKLFSFESNKPDAFYAGNARKGYVVTTTALNKFLDEGEIEAVLLSEVMRLKNKESMVYTVTAAISGIIASISTLAYWLSLLTGFGVEEDPAPNLIKLFTMSIVAPFASFLTHLVVPGKKEYLIDERCAQILDKEKLVSAMKKIETHENSVNFGHAFLFFSNPLHKDYVNILDFNLPTYSSLFKANPSLKKRILRIERGTHQREKTGVIKPIFYSLISYLFVLFGVIAFDTFSRKDFVFERAFMISTAFMGAVLIFFLLLLVLIWLRRRSF